MEPGRAEGSPDEQEGSGLRETQNLAGSPQALRPPDQTACASRMAIRTTLLDRSSNQGPRPVALQTDVAQLHSREVCRSPTPSVAVPVRKTIQPRACMTPPSRADLAHLDRIEASPSRGTCGEIP